MDEMATLAAAAAATLVTAMATDAWTGVRDAVAKLFRRRRRGRAAQRIETELDADAAAVERAASPDAVRRALLGRWTLEFSALLDDDPECLLPLAELVVAYASDLAENRRAFLTSQTAIAQDHAAVFAVQHGEHHSARPMARRRSSIAITRVPRACVPVGVPNRGNAPQPVAFGEIDHDDPDHGPGDP